MSKPTNAVAILIFFIVLLTIYSNSFDCAWHLDDFHNITNNSNIHLQSLSWPAIKKSFSGIRQNSINRPLSFLTFALNYYFGQDKVTGYHIVNFLIHFFSACFLFLTIRQAIAAANTSQFNKSYDFQVALLAALIWACHPIQVTAVTYIVQRMASLAGLFSIICLHFYLLGRSVKTINKFTCFSLSLLTAILAFASKENTVILPVIILTAELMIVQELSWETLKKNYKMIVLFTVCAGIFLAYLDLEAIVAGYQTRPFSLEERLLTQLRVLIKYLYLLFFPIDQNFALLHDVTYSKSLLSPPSTILSLLGLLAIFILALNKAKRYPLISFGVVFFFLTHLVEGSIIPLEMIFEHRNYLPSMFIFVLPAIIILRVYQLLSSRKIVQRIYIMVASLIFLSICHTTYSRNHDFKNEMNLWLDNNNKYPTLVRPYISLGNAYYQEKDFKKAIGITKMGLDATQDRRSAAETAKLFYNLGLQFLAINQLDYAEAFTLEAVKSTPKNPEFYLLLAKINSDKHQYQQALSYIQQALAINGKEARYHYISALLLVKSKLTDKAIAAAEQALRLDPDNKLPLYIIAEAYRANLNLNQSLLFYKKYLTYFPDNLAARIALLEIYQLQEKTTLRDLTYKEILTLLKDQNFEEAVDSFNNTLDLLDGRRDKNIRQAAREASENISLMNN